MTRRLDTLLGRLAPYAAAAGLGLALWYLHGQGAGDRHAATVNARANVDAESSIDGPTTSPRTAATAAPATASAAAAGAASLGSAPIAAAGAGPTPQQAGSASTTRVVVGRNDTMDAIFRRMALDKSDLAAIRHLPGIRQSLDFLKPGDAINVTHLHDGAIEELSRKVSETQTLDVVRHEDGFTAHLIENPVQTRTRTATAVIDTSLFQAAERADISDLVATKLANVFAWDIDFVLDIREGDRFTVVYEKIYQDGTYLRDGEVLAAEFINDGKVYRAVRFTADDGSVGYYTPDGKPLRKAFLRAPVDFTRVSSVFNPARLHPILNMIRGHMGTDYAAPTGTPVHAAGDGQVSFEGPRGGYGNAIVLSHSNGVCTLYGHMSRFAKIVRIGSHVNQGEVIGYVGMTGLATGPHLHYEYLTHGVHMNPQTVHLPGAEPLRAQSLVKFHQVAAPLLQSLSPPEGHPALAQAPADTPAMRASPEAPAAAVGHLAKAGKYSTKTSAY